MSGLDLFISSMMLLLTVFWIVQGSALLTAVALSGAFVWYLNHRKS